jgi:hypothetical protein
MYHFPRGMVDILRRIYGMVLGHQSNQIIFKKTAFCDMARAYYLHRQGYDGGNTPPLKRAERTILKI